MTNPQPSVTLLRDRLVIGARRSALARIQAEWVGRSLLEAWPDLSVEYRFMSTEGDRRPDVPLPQIGGKGLFTQDLERALADGTIDLAVHSLKDLPTDPVTEQGLLAVPVREDARDVFVTSGRPAEHPPGRDGTAVLRALPAGAVVGTSSLRRAAQVGAHRADLRVEPVRGNVETRLARLDVGDVDALILAAAGLRRLDRWPPGATVLDDQWLPAPGQGALGVQGRADDDRVRAYAAAIDDSLSRAEVNAERALLATLEGGCQVPVAARARVSGTNVQLDAAVYDVGGGRPIEGDESGPVSESARIGRRLADRMLLQGAGELVARARELTA